MASWLSIDIRAVWLVQSRRNLARLRFWLILIGYDPKTHSFESWGYLVYVFLFFSAWIFIVLTLLADAAEKLLRQLPFGGALPSAVTLGAFCFLAYFLIQLNLAVRRSPFIFSEADDLLLCLTPVDRRPVCVAWFLNEWLVFAIILAAGAIVLGYAVLESQALNELTSADLPRYILAGLRMLIISVPIHLGLHALAWTMGIWRFQGNRDIRWLRWAALISSVSVVGLWIISATTGGTFLPLYLWPLFYPFQAGLGEISVLPGLGLGCVWAITGMTLLWIAAGTLSLARASQETRGQEAFRSALWMGSSDMVHGLKQRERLGAGQQPSRLLSREGVWALLSRYAIQALRSGIWNALGRWGIVFGLVLSVLVLPDLEARGFMVLVLILVVSQRSIEPLRNDLAHWWLMRQTPQAMELQMIVDLSMPVLGVWILSLIALFVASIMGTTIPLFLALIFIPGSLGVALAAVLDVLRQCKTSHLVAGVVPDLTLLPVLLGSLVVGVPAGVYGLFFPQFVNPEWLGWLCVLLMIGFDCGLFLYLIKLVRNLYAPVEEVSILD